MITIDHKDTFLYVTVFGEFTLADYKEFEELADYTIKFRGPVNVLVDLREMLDFTVDVAWEEIRYSRAHSRDFKRIAVLTDNQWVTWSAWITQFFVEAEVMVFDDEAAARAWVEESAEPA